MGFAPAHWDQAPFPASGRALGKAELQSHSWDETRKGKKGLRVRMRRASWGALMGEKAERQVWGTIVLLEGRAAWKWVCLFLLCGAPGEAPASRQFIQLSACSHTDSGCVPALGARLRTGCFSHLLLIVEFQAFFPCVVSAQTAPASPKETWKQGDLGTSPPAVKL